MATTHLKWGEWNAICDVCGFKYKSSQLKKRWDGLMVCRDDWETRHPQDLIRIPKDLQSPAWVRPEVADEFISVTYAASNIGVQDNTVPAGDFDNNNEAL